MNKILAQTLVGLAGIVRGTLGSAFSYLNTLIKSGFNSTMQFHQEGIAFARQMGMSAKEAQAYTEVLTDRTERLAAKYGVAAEQVKELQRNISIATSRQLMLNDSQAEQFLQLNKLVGSSTTTKFTEEMMNGMGGQLETVTGAVSKAYATAAKSGLNAQKVSEKIASNLSMANRLSFRTGIDGLTRMAMQAEKVGMSLQSVEAVANNFMEIDDAIEHAAQLNMLGGAAGIFGGNPLDMAYEANYDPEALQKRMTSMLGGLAQFDAKTGMANINGVNMDFARQIARAMGISPEEAARVAKKNAEVKFKESTMNKEAYRAMGYSDEQIDFLINKSNVKNGKVMFTDKNGGEHELNGARGKIDKAVLDEMMKYQGMSDRDIMEENARSLSSINEILTGLRDSISAMFAKFIEGLFPTFQGDLKSFGTWIKGKLLPLAKSVGEATRGAYEWLKEHKEPIKSLISGVIAFLKFATEHWKILIGFFVGKKLLGMLNSVGIGKGLGGRMASGAASSSTPSMRNITRTARADYRAGRSLGMTRREAFSTANRDAVRAAGGYGKLAKAGVKMAKGGGVAALAGMAGGMTTDYLVENGTIEEGGTTHKLASAGTRALEYGGTGAMLGGMIGSVVPVIGNAAGAAVGGAIGAIWGGISGYLDANKAAEEGAKAAKASQHENGGFISGFITEGKKGAESPIKVGKNSQDTAYEGEVILNPTQQRNFMALANNETTVKSKPIVGEKPEHIYKPNKTEISNVNGNTVTVKDFNINLSGTLRLDGGGSSKNIDINELLRDQEFVTALKNMIKTSINQDINGGRFMNDLATMGGFPAQTSIYARNTSV